MKTPDEIKRGLAACRSENDWDCRSACPYKSNSFDCVRNVCADALAYIRQLEREREALINIVKQTRFACWNCKYHVGGCTRRVEEISLRGDCFEWRGVEEEA